MNFIRTLLVAMTAIGAAAATTPAAHAGEHYPGVIVREHRVLHWDTIYGCMVAVQHRDVRKGQSPAVPVTRWSQPRVTQVYRVSCPDAFLAS